MKAKRNIRLLGALYFLIILLELIGECALELAESPILVFIIKPLMMPVLALYLFSSVKDRGIGTFYKLIFAALFFSWLGDIFLMDTWTGNNLFLYGLGAFLMAHLMYIASFRMLPQKMNKSLLASKPYAILPIAIYFAGLIYGLYRYGNESFFEMQYPLVLYAMVIMVMVITALNRKNRVDEVSHNLVFIGALLFMFSDSIIATNMFTNALSDNNLLTRVLIMATYALGQYLIVEGCIRQESFQEPG